MKLSVSNLYIMQERRYKVYGLFILILLGSSILISCASSTNIMFNLDSAKIEKTGDEIVLSDLSAYCYEDEKLPENINARNFLLSYMSSDWVKNFKMIEINPKHYKISFRLAKLNSTFVLGNDFYDVIKKNKHHLFIKQHPNYLIHNPIKFRSKEIKSEIEIGNVSGFSNFMYGLNLSKFFRKSCERKLNFEVVNKITQMPIDDIKISYRLMKTATNNLDYFASEYLLNCSSRDLRLENTFNGITFIHNPRFNGKKTHYIFSRYYKDKKIYMNEKSYVSYFFDDNRSKIYLAEDKKGFRSITKFYQFDELDATIKVSAVSDKYEYFEKDFIFSNLWHHSGKSYKSCNLKIELTPLSTEINIKTREPIDVKIKSQNDVDIESKLLKLKLLYDKDLIDEEEYKKEKEKLLNSL